MDTISIVPRHFDDMRIAHEKKRRGFREKGLGGNAVLPIPTTFATAANDIDILLSFDPTNLMLIKAAVQLRLCFNKLSVQMPAMAEATTAVPVTEDTSVVPGVSNREKRGERSSAHREWGPFVNLRRDVEPAFEDFQRGPWRLPFMHTAFDASPVWPGQFIWYARALASPFVATPSKE
jgi:hypothetical protein